MVLSNVDIQQALDDGDLKIEPEPMPREAKGDAPCPYDTTGVNLRLGVSLSVPITGQPFAFDPQRMGIAKFLALAYRSVEIEESGFTLDPGMFVLGKSLERVELPIRPDRPCLAARIEGRSSYARCGLIVHFTAPTIHAGFEGTITLEMKNLGEYPIMLRPRSEIAQLVIERVSGRPSPKPSQFQHQGKPTGLS